MKFSDTVSIGLKTIQVEYMGRVIEESQEGWSVRTFVGVGYAVSQNWIIPINKVEDGRRICYDNPFDSLQEAKDYIKENTFACKFCGKSKFILHGCDTCEECSENVYPSVRILQTTNRFPEDNEQ